MEQNKREQTNEEKLPWYLSEEELKKRNYIEEILATENKICEYNRSPIGKNESSRSCSDNARWHIAAYDYCIKHKNKAIQYLQKVLEESEQEILEFESFEITEHPELNLSDIVTRGHRKISSFDLIVANEVEAIELLRRLIKNIYKDSPEREKEELSDLKSSAFNLHKYSGKLEPDKINDYLEEAAVFISDNPSQPLDYHSSGWTISLYFINKQTRLQFQRKYSNYDYDSYKAGITKEKEEAERQGFRDPKENMQDKILELMEPQT